MIDVHILTIPGREQWLSECLQSLKDEPVNAFVVPGIVGNFPESRKNGYAEGSAEWVTYVDDDDRVIPGAFGQLEKAIQENPQYDAFYMYEEAINEAGLVISKPLKEPHHLIVYPRSFINNNHDVFNSRNPDSELLKRLPKTPKVICVEVVGYQWRQHRKSNSKGAYRD